MDDGKIDGPKRSYNGVEHSSAFTSRSSFQRWQRVRIRAVVGAIGAAGRAIGGSTGVRHQMEKEGGVDGRRGGGTLICFIFSIFYSHVPI